MVEFVYQCTSCRKRYARDAVRYLCPECAQAYRPGLPLTGVLTAEFDYATIGKKFRRTKPDWNLFSAVEPEFFPPYVLGTTPFFRSVALGNLLGWENVWLKNDGLLPSGSLKDRASFLVAAEANRLGEKVIVTASTGNAASALAAVCAAAGKRAIIFVPQSAPKAKLVQMLLAGAQVVPVNGTYDDAFRLSLEFTARHGGLNRNTAYHPLTIEGKKSVGLEIWRQNNWQVPAAILVPTGDGVILAGVYKAFYDLQAAGLTTRVPKLVCVQAKSSDAIHRYVQTGRYRDAVKPVTMADSISVSVPSNAHFARAAIMQSGGFSVTVSEAEIVEGQRILAASTGVFAEPAAAASVAALRKFPASSGLSRRDQLVVLITGHGLKDVDSALRHLRVPAAIEPTEAGLAGVARRLTQKGGLP